MGSNWIIVQLVPSPIPSSLQALSAVIVLNRLGGDSRTWEKRGDAGYNTHSFVSLFNNKHEFFHEMNNYYPLQNGFLWLSNATWRPNNDNIWDKPDIVTILLKDINYEFVLLRCYDEFCDRLHDENMPVSQGLNGIIAIWTCIGCDVCCFTEVISI